MNVRCGNIPKPNAENQKDENAGVAFVKGANETNELFEKNKQTIMYDEQVRTNKAKN